MLFADVRAEGRWRVAALSLCVIGAVLRFAFFLQRRSLWYDEAALALNLVSRGFIGLLAPLDYFQTAPPLFLWVQRVAVLLFGRGEWALRAVPLVVGLVTPFVMWRVARRILPAPAAVVAVALTALSPTLVRYSAEAKPYGLDALMTLLVLDRAIAAAAPNARRSEWAWLGVVGVIAILSSTPAVFVLAGAIGYLGLETMKERDWPRTRNVALVGALWGVTFLMLSLTLFRPLLGEQSPTGRFMQWYWAANFLTPGPPGITTKISAQVWGALTNTFLGSTALRGSTTLMLGLVVVGLAALVVSRRTTIAALLTVPIVALVVASFLRRYPIAERLVLFAAPLSALLIASGLLALNRIGQRAVARAGVAMVGFFTVFCARGALAQLASEDGRQETRGLIATAASNGQAGTPVWVSGGGEVAWRYYTRDTATVQRSGPANPLAPNGGTLGHNVLIGAWYAAIPERIVPVADDSAAASKPSPWSTTEARRIREVAHPCAMAFLSNMMPGESVALLAGTSRLGGREIDTIRKPGAELHRICFDTTESPRDQ